jgi:oligopeptidase B
MTVNSTPPSAARRPHSFTRHGITVEDSWAWLRDPGYPDVKDKDVLAYLDEENGRPVCRDEGPHQGR